MGALYPTDIARRISITKPQQATPQPQTQPCIHCEGEVMWTPVAVRLSDIMPEGTMKCCCTGIVVTASTARQTGAASAAQGSQSRLAKAALEPTRAAPAQQRAVPLPRPLVSDQLRSSHSSPDAGMSFLHLLVL